MKVKHKGMLILLAVMGLLLVTTTSVFAKTVSFTQTFHNVTDSAHVQQPCTGAPGTVTTTYDVIVFHVTLDTTTGTGHMTETGAGSLVFVPDDSTLPTLTGHFVTRDDENQNIDNFAATATFTFESTGSDGSHLRGHFLAHMSVSATSVTIQFFKMTCS